jgi:hypothetical protein
MSLHSSKNDLKNCIKNTRQNTQIETHKRDELLTPLLLKYPKETQFIKYIRLCEKAIHKYNQMPMKCVEYTQNSRVYKSMISGENITLNICFHYYTEILSNIKPIYCKIYIENKGVHPSSKHVVLFEQETQTTKRMYKKVKEYLLDFEYEILDHFPDDSYISDEVYTVGDVLSNEEYW